MQDAWTRYPSFEGRTNAIPTRSAALTAAPKKGTPQGAEPVAKATQRRHVPRYGVISVVAVHNTFQPWSDDADPFMHSLAQLHL